MQVAPPDDQILNQCKCTLRTLLEVQQTRGIEPLTLVIFSTEFILILVAEITQVSVWVRCVSGKVC